MGPRRARAAAALTGAPEHPSALLAGVCGGLDPRLEPGDIVLASELRTGERTIACPDPTVLAGVLRRGGLRVHIGPIASSTGLVFGSRRRELARSGALAVDMESAWLAGDCTAPLTTLRVVLDTPRYEIHRPARAAIAWRRAFRALREASALLEGWAAALAPREVLLAAPRASCAGVTRAVEIVERALEQRGSPIYVRKQIVHNAHVVGSSSVAAPCSSTRSRRCRPRDGDLLRARRLAGRAPERLGARPRCDRRHLPAGREGPCRGAPLRSRGLPDRPGRPLRSRGGRGDGRRGARAHAGDRPRRRGARAPAARRSPRGVPDADDARGRRDGRDRRRAALATARPRAPRLRGHLLRHAEPPGRGARDRAALRSRARGRLGELVQLAPPRRGRAARRHARRARRARRGHPARAARRRAPSRRDGRRLSARAARHAPRQRDRRSRRRHGDRAHVATEDTHFNLPPAVRVRTVVPSANGGN